jgi:hypothetical protein
MQGTHQDTDVNRPIALHGRYKPDRSLVIALIKDRLIELPANSLRGQILQRMVEGTQD